MLSKMYRTPPPRSNPPSPVNLTSAPSLVSQFLRPPSSSSSSSSVSKTVGATVVASEIMARLAISTVAAPICVFIWPASKGWGKQDGKCRNCIWYKCTASTPGTSRACKKQDCSYRDSIRCQYTSSNSFSASSVPVHHSRPLIS